MPFDRVIASFLILGFNRMASSIRFYSTWSYSDMAATKMVAVMSSKQLTHFLLSDLCPPTSTTLSGTSEDTLSIVILASYARCPDATCQDVLVGCYEKIQKGHHGNLLWQHFAFRLQKSHDCG
ncbi:hypothetical protein SeMB42_g06089 [Synchytrium endobioticum]|uniref:Uncharacterized protein n=1 Tax=Synchytrium endobioticum TaxID=286115 RepID=A0A507CKA2_9FUNG|nr:hypothetical protein SeMB42_g06089 [Synchytrium endobioticum]